MEAHLTSEIRIPEIADQAIMSVANFYRYFSALTGFTFKEYLRKRRLSFALYQLQSTNKKILDIALDICFESHESFTRAFKEEFGLNPSEVKNCRQTLRGIGPKILVKETFMRILIKNLTEQKVAYYRVISRAPEDDAWQHIKSWAESCGIFDKPYRVFGFNNPNPENMEQLKDDKGQIFFANTDNSEYGYEFQITVDDDVFAENNGRGVDIKTIPGGRFAVMSIGVGCEERDIEKGWACFGELLKKGEYKPTGRWFEEHLDFNPHEENENFRMDLYVEIEK